MADRVSATIRLGGALARSLLDTLLEIIAEERLSTDWDGGPPSQSDIPEDVPLELMANEVVGGDFDRLQSFCIAHGLAFQRWCGAYPGGWEAERLVYDGISEPRCYTVTDSDLVVICRREAMALGSAAAIEAWFESADIAVPPLTIIEDAVAT